MYKRYQEGFLRTLQIDRDEERQVGPQVMEHQDHPTREGIYLNNKEKGMEETYHPHHQATRPERLEIQITVTIARQMTVVLNGGHEGQGDQEEKSRGETQTTWIT